MDKNKIFEILNDLGNKPNKDLLEVMDLLYNEHENTKQLIIDLTRYLDQIEESYNKIEKEIEKRSNL